MRTLPVALLLIVWTAAAFAAAPAKPNLIIINIDDLGYAEIGPFGGRNRTPELDRMAKEGRKLTSHYAAPVCSPSRASLMTGCYPKRALPVPHVLFPGAEVGLNPAERTIAEVLKDAGYVTAAVGKWHLGDQLPFLPTRQGFDSYFGLPYSNDMGPAADGVKSNRGMPVPQAKAGVKAKAAPVSDETGIRGAQPPLALIENETVIGRVRAEEQIQLQRRYTERAVAFIRERHDRPFFLYFAPNAVHFPVYPRDEFMGKSGNGLLGDWVQEIDWSVGQVLAALRELKLDANTLVIFTSDNGGPVNQGAVNTPLRGSKGTTFEGGIRVCTIAWWPGRIPAGTSTDAITSMMDILPTFARLGGTTAPTDRKIDGVDLWPVLTGNPSQAPRDVFHYFRGATLDAVRSGPWKLHLAKGELYHLGNDIAEAKDVAAAHPEEVKKLRALAAAMAGDLGVDQFGPGCRELGRVKNPQPIIAADGTVRRDMAGKTAVFP
ncbi:sulfatase family protein [Horticoccus sp. 23ND18S-11]|uniref:sulfatase family protein n=1 Tax=Horticoccus sp. 23ND18S-11 TaxID=3391832 RepID=UPI0039C9AE6E